MADFGVMLNSTPTSNVRWKMGADYLPNRDSLLVRFTPLLGDKPDDAETRRFTLALADFVNNYR